MTIVSFFSRQRRVVLLCAATVALHLVTINWIGGRLGMTDSAREATPQVIQADLRLTPPPPAPPAVAAPKPAPAPHPAAHKVRPAPPAPPAAADSQAVSASAEAAPGQPEAAPDSAPEAAAPEQTGAPAPADDIQSAPAATPAAAPPPVMRRFKVDLPPSARFELDVKRKDADGTNWSGSARMSWQTDGARYQASQEVGVSLLIARVNLLTVKSEGTIDDYGIAPETFIEKRRNRAETATHFQQKDKRITFSASEQSVPLQGGAQDRATLLFQLAGIGRADINQFGSDIDILVGEDRNAQFYRFQLVGEEEVETGVGKLVTIHLSRPPRPGSYNARLDVWLAPALDWYPVQIRNTEGNGAVTTQTLSRLIK